MFVIKNIFVSNYNIHYKIMNDIFMCGVLKRKNALNTHFAFFCPFFSLVGVSLIRIQQ